MSNFMGFCLSISCQPIGLGACLTIDLHLFPMYHDHGKYNVQYI